MTCVYSTDSIINSFAAFANFCISNKEVPYFKYDSIEVDKFFYDMKKEHPREFEMVSFNTNGHTPFSQDVDDAKMMMLTCGYLYSLSIKFHPHIISKRALKEFNKIENKEIYLKIAKRFYDKFSCNMDGDVGKHTNFKNIEEIF